MYVTTWNACDEINYHFINGTPPANHQMIRWYVVVRTEEVVLCNWDEPELSCSNSEVIAFEGPLLEAWPVYEAYACMVISKSKEKS